MMNETRKSDVRVFFGVSAVGFMTRQHQRPAMASELPHSPHDSCGLKFFRFQVCA